MLNPHQATVNALIKLRKQRKLRRGFTKNKKKMIKKVETRGETMGATNDELFTTSLQ